MTKKKAYYFLSRLMSRFATLQKCERTQRETKRVRWKTGWVADKEPISKNHKKYLGKNGLKSTYQRDEREG